MQTFELKVLHYIHELKLIDKGDRLLVAVSGGMDSIALLHFLSKYQQQLCVKVFVVHVDHMLRGKDSVGDRQFVETFCKQRGIRVFATEVPIRQILDDESGNLQAVCRRERYRYFEEVMKSSHLNKLVTAHHADDQLESMLMALTKGAIVKGIQGMRVMRPMGDVGMVIRPLLSVTKDEIKQYLQKEYILYREDVSNDKDDYLRNRLRHHVIPLLKKENESVSRYAVHLAKHLQEDADYLMEQAERLFFEMVTMTAENVYSMEIDVFQKSPLALQKRILLILLNYLYKNTNTIQSYALWTSVWKLCETMDGSAELNLPRGFKAVRSYNVLTIYKSDVMPTKVLSVELPIDQWIEVEGFRIYIGYNHNIPSNLSLRNLTTYYFSSQELALPLKVRGRQEGDRIALKGMNRSKRLSRLMIDEKIPLAIRDTVPVLVTKDNEIVAVVGIRVSKYFSTEKRMSDDMVCMIAFASS